MSGAQPVFLHVDLDAFFASVEQLDHPDWKGKPVIVGGKPGDRRAVVSTASYEARAYGVHSAMPLGEAVRRCPNGIFVRGNMKRYHELSERVMAIFRNYSPDVQQMSVDEAFIDLTGTERLFGAPADTARRIKQEVKTEVGLTVSIGMASTRYIAKIASGLQKPDGLCIVPPGKETEFMLSLPLEKIWGAGERTQKKLRESGMRTARDIYQRSLPLLQSIFGKAGGTFLYNAVRGGEAENFSREAKNHSISSESTYAWDLTDRDAIDTALLELSYTVAFRLLRENARSSSVGVKIRYEDFTTVSIQDTSGREITSTDDLFDRVKMLFYRKYEPGRGIRLLGVSAQNLESAESPRQAELFDFGEEKKRKVEHAILAAKQKNPALQITKARLLEKPLALFFFLAFSLRALHPLTAAGNEIARTSTRTADGAGSLVFDSTTLPLSAGDEAVPLLDTTVAGKPVTFSALGYWQTLFTGNASYRFGFGSQPAFSAPAPVLTQKADLSLWFLLDRHWFFEASFADEFETNTVAAGYTKGDGILKEARLANRGIVFPESYSVDTVQRGIGGSRTESEAPGFSLSFAGDTWKADAAIRYDMLKAEEKTWYGKNSVSEADLDLAGWERGSRYVLPSSESVQAVAAVYVEASDGTYRDGDGRTYRRLDESQYLLSVLTESLYLAKDALSRQSGATKTAAQPAVAVAFTSSVPDTTALVNDTKDLFAHQGDYADEEAGLDLTPYLAPERGTIDGKTVLYLQHPAGFSPFAVANRYDAGLFHENTDVLVISRSTRAVSHTFSAIPADDTAFTTDDFFSDSHSYVDIYAGSTQEESTHSLTASVRFPFALTDPGLYLGFAQKSDLVLSIRTYTAVTRFDIGTKAVAGTVRVYKNGVLDSGASYDEESGSITLSSAVSESDHIRATWYEDANDADTGAIAAAAGVRWALSERLTADVSAAARWTIAAKDAAASSDDTAPGFVTLASGVCWKGDRLTLSNTAATSIETANTTGCYSILSDSDDEQEWQGLQKDAAVALPPGFEPSLNARNDESAAYPVLTAEKNGSVPCENGSIDTALPEGYAVPVSWNFASLSTTAEARQDEPYWAAAALYLPNAASVIASSSRFTLYLKNAAASTSYSVYLQLGVQADDDFDCESVRTIPTWHISADDELQAATGVERPFIPTEEGWQRVSILLQDEDRLHISQGTGARLVICATESIKGTIYAGSYRAEGSDFVVTACNALTVSAPRQPGSSVSFAWKQDEDADELSLSVSRYIEEIDLRGYSTLTLTCIAGSERTFTGEEATVTLTLDRPTEYGTFSPCVSVTLSAQELTAAQGKEQTLSIDLIHNRATFAGKTPASSPFVDTDIIPTRVQFCITQSPGGSLSVSSLTLSGITPDIVLEDRIFAQWKQDGAVLTSAGGKALVRDLLIKADTAATATVPTSRSAQETAGSFSAQGSAHATLFGFTVSANAVHAPDTTRILASASHSIESASPLFDTASFGESWYFDVRSKTLSKAHNAKLDFAAAGVPVLLSGQTTARRDNRAQNQEAKTSASFSPGNLTLTLRTKATQKHTAADSFRSASSYTELWREGTRLAFDTGKKDAQKRSVAFSLDAGYTLPIINLVPKLSLETTGTYAASTSTLFTDSEMSTISLPFRIRKHTFALSWTKKAGGTLFAKTGGSYQRDTSDLLTATKRKEWFLRAFPVYDLISSALSHTILEDSAFSAGSTESLYYEGTYSASWKRSIFGNARDLIFPAFLSASFSRSIHTASSISDFYQLKASIGYTALNLFGTQGSLPVAHWFRQDEYTAQGSATLKIPRTQNANLTMLYTLYVQGAFYISRDNIFKTGAEASYETRDDWSGKFTLIWKRRGTVSPAAGLIDVFSKNGLGANAKLLRTDSVNLASSSASTGSKKTKLTYSGECNHQLDIAISDAVTINTAVGGSYAATHGTSMVISATASIGATIRF